MPTQAAERDALAAAFPDPNRADAGPSAAEPPRVPRREEWLDLEPLEFPRFRYRAWLGFPDGTYRALLGSGEAQRTALAAVFLEHNGWRDEDDRPYPPLADADAFWAAIPTRVAYLMLKGIEDALYAPPKSKATRR